MLNPQTGKEFTEAELLQAISEDVGRLSKIEQTLQGESEDLTIYDRIAGIELRTFETVNVLFSIKRLITIMCIILFGILLLVFLK